MKKLLFACLLSLAASVFAAAPYKVGDAFESFTTKDQHEKDYVFATDTRLVIVSFDMGDGKKANGWFAEKGADFLPAKKAIFIANVYGMTGVGRVFAFPKMRKYPHRILLADAENFLARYPAEKDRLTVIRLDEAGKVSEISFVDPAKGLDGVFAK